MNTKMVDTGRTAKPAADTSSDTLTGLGFQLKHIPKIGWKVTGPDAATRIIKSPSAWWANELAKQYGVDAKLLATGFTEAAEAQILTDAPNGNPADTVAGQLIEIAKKNVLEIFQDQYHEGYAVIVDSMEEERDSSDSSEGISVSSTGSNDPPSALNSPTPTHVDTPTASSTPITPITAITFRRNVTLNGGVFKRWLARQYHLLTSGAAGKDTIASAVLVLDAEAQLKPEKTLYVRCAPDGAGGIWWDMCDQLGRAIHITKDGWTVETPPSIFRRNPQMLPLMEPKTGGKLSKILEYTSLRHGGDELLAISKIVTDLIPEVPMPNGAIVGVQGSGKTTFHLMENSVIDPSTGKLIGLPTKNEDLIQHLEHHYLSIFDNVSTITREQSDIFCRAITGGGVEKRELFTTDDSFSRYFMRKLGINGINTMIEKSDLFSRTILMDWVPVKNWIDEETMRAKIKADTPEIMGAILDTLVKAMNLYDAAKPTMKARMGSFTKWGYAIAEAIGVGGSVFEKAYKQNLKNQDAEAIKASIVADFLLRYLKHNKRNIMEGYAVDIKTEIEEWFAELLPKDTYNRPMGEPLTKKKGWPADSPAFGKRLNEVIPSLATQGCIVESRRTNKGTKYTIKMGSDSDEGQQTLDVEIGDAITPEELRRILNGDANDTKTSVSNETEVKEVAPESVKVDPPKPSLREVCEKLVASFIALKEPATIAELAEKSGLSETDIESVLEKVYRIRGSATFDVASNKWRWWEP